jgi:hypothetical protein
MSQSDQDTNGATASESGAPPSADLGADNGAQLGAGFDPGKVWNDTVHGVQEQWTQFTDNASHAVQGVVDGWNQWTASPEGQQAQDFVSNVIHTAQGPFNDSISDPNGDFGSAVRGLDDLVHDAPVVEPEAADSGADFPPDHIPARFDDRSIADPAPNASPVEEAGSVLAPSDVPAPGVDGGNEPASGFEGSTGGDVFSPGGEPDALTPMVPPPGLGPEVGQDAGSGDPFADGQDQRVLYPEAQRAPYADYQRFEQPSDPFADGQDPQVLYPDAQLAPYADYARSGERSDPFAEGQNPEVLFPGAQLAPYANYETDPTVIDPFAGDATSGSGDVIYQDATSGEYFQVDPSTGDVTTVDPSTISGDTTVESSTELDPNSVNPDYVDSSGQVSADPTGDSGDTSGFDTSGYDTSGFDTSGYDPSGSDTGSYDTGSYDTGSYDTGSSDAGYDSGYSAPVERAPVESAPVEEPPPPPPPEPAPSE